jgi:hypothetical protein
MENKVNKILNSIAPTRREKLSKQREVKLALMDDLREHTNQLEELEYGARFDEIDALVKKLDNALNEAKVLAQEIEPMIQPFADNDYGSMVDNAERDIAKYERAIEELGLPMDEEVQYLRDEIIGKYWYGDGERSFNEEPNFTYSVEQAKKLD